MADPLELFRKRLKSTREKKGITLKEIAEFIGVSEATVQRYESKVVKDIPHERILCIAEYLGVSPGYLMGWEKPMYSAQSALVLADIAGDRELMDHVELMHSMDPDKRQKVYSYARFVDSN